MCAVSSLLIPLTTLEYYLHYEGDSWQEETHNQDEKREVEMFHSQDFKFLFLFFFLVSNFVDQQTSLEITNVKLFD